MMKFIEVIEVPFLLLVLSLHEYTLGYTSVSIFLLLVGIFRLVVNLMTNK